MRTKSGRVASVFRVCAWAYLLLLVAVALTFRFVGERVWFLVPLLYLPRVLFLLPLAATIPAALYAGPRSVVVAQVVALLVGLFPMMGLELHLAAFRAVPPEVKKIRVLSYNVFFGRKGCGVILDEVASHAPDVIALQATGNRCKREVAARFPDFHLQPDFDFILASRFPILDAFKGDLLPGALPSQWWRYTLDTPLGAIDLFNVHPFSPRPGFEALRGEGLKNELRDQLADPHVPHGRAEVDANTATREEQLVRITAAAAASKNPVIIAGDTNLPALSRLYAKYLDSGRGRWRDGFAQVGAGFGYTFPAQGSRHQMPWMRLDRIFASRELRFLHVEVGGKGASDHCPVIADLTRDGTDSPAKGSARP